MANRPAEVEAEIVSETPYDASDPEQVNEARKRQGRHRRERLEIVRTTMATRQGRRWVYDMLVGAHIFATSFVPGDPHGSAFKEGERNRGLALMADIMAACPDEYVTMVKEGNARG